MKYNIRIAPAAQRDFAKLPADIKPRILSALKKLESNPRPAGVKKLKETDWWRIRVGDYQILYEIHDKELLVIVFKMAHRRDVYE